MAATRLTDSQKSELVARYRDGAASQELAETYGCSINTVTRVVKATLTASDYEQLKQQRAGVAASPPNPKRPTPRQRRLRSLNRNRSCSQSPSLSCS